MLMSILLQLPADLGLYKMKEHPKYTGYCNSRRCNRLPVKGERMPINEDGLVYANHNRMSNEKNNII